MPTLNELANEYGKSPKDTMIDILNGHSSIKEASQEVGMSRKTINYWINKFGINRLYVLPETKIALDPDSK